METFPTNPRFLLRRWRLFTVLALIYILVYFYRVSLAVVANDITRDLALTPQQLGTLSGILFYVYAVAQLPLGPLIDRFGGRLAISGCGVLTAIGGLLFSTAQTLPAAMAARVLIGVGTAAVLMATFTIFSHWYSHQEFGKISGFMVAVGNLGNLAATAPLAMSVAAIGWRHSFLAIAILQMLATLLVFFAVRDRPPLLAAAEPVPEVAKPGLLAAWREIFGNGHFWLLGGISFFWYGNYLALQGLWGGPYLMEVLQLSRAQTGQLLMYTSLGFIAGSMLSDFFVRRLFGSHKRALIFGQGALLLLMSAFLGWAVLVPPGLRAGLFFAIGLAVSSGVLIYPIIRAMFPLRIVGTALTSLNFFVLLGAAVVQQMMGVIIGARALPGAPPGPTAYHVAFLLPVAGLAAAIALFSFAHDYTRPQ
jgi:sugar phosphate permease